MCVTQYVLARGYFESSFSVDRVEVCHLLYSADMHRHGNNVCVCVCMRVFVSEGVCECVCVYPLGDIKRRK